MRDKSGDARDEGFAGVVREDVLLLLHAAAYHRHCSHVDDKRMTRIDPVLRSRL